MSRRPHFLQPLLKRSAGPLVLRIEGRPEPVATTLEGAFDSATRKKGLLGRDGLPAGTALIIAPCNLVHTFAMHFPIDLIFAARDGRVLKIKPAVPARRIAGAWGAFATIEMAAGSAGRADVKVGDRLMLDTPPDHVPRDARAASTR